MFKCSNVQMFKCSNVQIKLLNPFSNPDTEGPTEEDLNTFNYFFASVFQISTYEFEFLGFIPCKNLSTNPGSI
jgi:hypothetical protein